MCRKARAGGGSSSSQKGRVYAAERAISNLGFENTGRYLGPCVEYIGRVWEDKRVRAGFPFMGKACPDVLDGRGRRRAGGSRYSIKLPRWSRKEAVILDEIAHAIVDWGRVTRTVPTDAAHGRTFCRVFLQLVQTRMGTEAAKILRESFRQHRVRYRRVHVMSPAQKAEYAERARAILKGSYHKKEARS